jgi:hypothetical protein
MRHILLAATVAAFAFPAMAQQRIPVGHLMDNSGATSDVGVPYGQGVADALNWVNATRGGVAGRQLAVSGFDYGYQAPRAIAQYQAWTSRERVVAIQGWGTADTEALIGFVTRDRIPYISGSYSAALTDPSGKARPDSKAAPFNFFYGPSYSDAARALVQWAADDWKARGGQGRPKYVHMGANHPYPNSPKEAAETLARELGFEVLSDAEEPGRQLRLSGQHRGVEHFRAARLPGGRRAGAIPGQCVGHGRERHEGRGCGRQWRGVPGAHGECVGRHRARHGKRARHQPHQRHRRHRLSPGALPGWRVQRHADGRGHGDRRRQWWPGDR